MFNLKYINLSLVAKLRKKYNSSKKIDKCINLKGN